MIIIDEIGYAKEVVEMDRINKNSALADMILVARYLKWELNLTDDQIARWLKTALSKSGVDYVKKRKTWNEKVEQAISVAGKREPYPIKSIPIYQSELGCIAKAEDKGMERLLFGILVYCKNRFLKTGNEYINLDLKELFSSCRIPCTKDEQKALINKLIQMGFLDYKIGAQIYFKPNFSCYDNSERIAAYVTDTRELGYQYRQIQYFADDITTCARCKKPIKQNANRTKGYCKECATKRLPAEYGTILKEILEDFHA